jgi:Fe-S cluster assembly protein SufD
MTTESTLQTGFSQESFDDFVAARHEPAWLRLLRKEAWDVFQETPLPPRNHEEWRRTDLRMFRLEAFALPRPEKGTGPFCAKHPSGPEGKRGPSPFPASATSPSKVPLGLLEENVELAGRAVALDSHPYRAQLDSQWRDRGVVFGSLDESVRQSPDLLRPHFLSPIVAPKTDKFSALNAACWSGGTLLYVPRGVAVDQPLYSLSLLSPDGVDFGRTLIVLEEGAEATLLAETASLDPAASGLHCGTIEIRVGPGARLRYVNLQNWGTGVWHFAHQRALLHQDARLQWTIGALGSRLAKVNQHVALIGPRAETQVNGVMFTEGKQHLSYHTLQHHQAPECKSDLLYKGALQDRSHLVWRGMIHVDRDAQKTDGYQRNDNLILSDTVRVDSIPGLEILADDVKCTHGATSGRVDDEQIFYASARGLTRKEAVRMIVAGFFQQVFDRITIESVRNALGDAISRRVREYQ